MLFRIVSITSGNFLSPLRGLLCGTGNPTAGSAGFTGCTRSYLRSRLSPLFAIWLTNVRGAGGDLRSAWVARSGDRPRRGRGFAAIGDLAMATTRCLYRF
jgi:hypothetical protein